MRNKLIPTIYVKNIYEINFEQLKKHNIKIICFDLDNTLDKPESYTTFIDSKLKKLMYEISKDFKIIICSNNKMPGRVESFVEQFNIEMEYIKKMKKPFQKNYINSILDNYNKNEMIFVGDKLSTDILGANLYGAKSILVDPMYPRSKKWYAIVMQWVDFWTEKIASTKRGSYFNNLEEYGK